MKTLIITGGRFDKEFVVSFLENKKYDYVIAVDGGLAYAEILGIIPDMIVGDFDTMGSEKPKKYENLGCAVRKYNPEKDDTDTEIAIRQAVGMGSDMDILCATGGRIDHLLANIHNMKIAMDEGLKARLIDAGNVVWLEKDDFIMENKDTAGKYISFVPFDGVVKNLKLKGFKYPLDGYDLKPGASRCVSNEIADEKAYVEFQSGCLIVIVSSDVKSE